MGIIYLHFSPPPRSHTGAVCLRSLILTPGPTYEFIKENLGWLIGFFSLGMAFSSVLILIGTFRQKIVIAADAALKLKRELYEESGRSNYVPRAEYDPDKKKIELQIYQTRQELYSNCAKCRAECRNDIAEKLDIQRSDIRTLTSWVMGAVKAAGDRRSGEDRRHDNDEAIEPL